MGVSMGEGSPACFAPFAGLYFEPSGAIRVCCTSKLVIGTWVPGRTDLREVWDGVTVGALRDAMHSQDFSFGCIECEVDIERGGRAASLAVHFDRFGPGVAPGYPKLIDFALSNRCNLACVMCNGELSSTIRAQREHRPPMPTVYDDDFFDQLREFLPHTERLQFKGGEPFLAPEARRVWDMLLELGHRPEISVTTNATVWNSRVEAYVRDLGMQVIASVDGMEAATLEAIRVGVDAEQVWQNIDRFQAATEAAGTCMTLSFCLMPQNWREVGRFLRECDRRGANANVILVNQPDASSLGALPHDELAAVIAGLEAEDGPLRQALGPALDEWDRMLAPVQALRGAAVEIRTPLPPSRYVPINAFAGHAMDPAEVRSRLDELRVQQQLDPLVLHVVGEIIDQVATVPQWAADLEPERWIGSAVAVIPERLEALLGPLEPAQLDRHDDGVVAATLYPRQSEGGIVAVRSYLFPPPPGGRGPSTIAILPVEAVVEP